MRSKFTVGCFAIIFNESNQVLLTHRRDRDLWVLPGGGMESGESPQDAIIQEVKEETGLDVQITKFIGIYSKPFEDDIVFLFACEQLDGNLTLDDEADQLEYYDVDNLPVNTHKSHIVRIHDALASTGEIVFNVQKWRID